MASTKKQGYVITRSKSLKEYFTASAAYDRPQWVKLDEATIYPSADAAQQAAKKLWMKGSFAAKVQSLTELVDIEMEMPPKKEVNNEPEDDKEEMVAARQSDDLEAEVKSMGDDEDEMDDETSDLSSEEPRDEVEQDEEDTLLGQHLRRAAGMEGEETARLHPEELRMLGKKRPDMKEEVADYHVGSKVVPMIGPHKGVPHEVIHVFDDGSFNIKPLGLKAESIRYRLGAVKARPDQVEMVSESDAEHWEGSEGHRAKVKKAVDKLAKEGHSVYMQDYHPAKGEKGERTVLNVRHKDKSKSEQVVEGTLSEAEFKMPARPGNDPAAPSENDTTAATMKDPKSTMVDFEDPVGEEDKPETDLTYAVAHEHDEKVKVPAEVMSQLKAVVADFKKAAEDNNMVNDVKGSFALTAASALQRLVDDLELGTVAGVKQAQYHMSSYMSPIVNHIPADVVNFIGRGGRKSSLKDLFNVKWDKMRGVE